MSANSSSAGHGSEIERLRGRLAELEHAPGTPAETGTGTGPEVLRRYELLAESGRDIILFIRRDDGRILEANAAAVAAYGYSREELLSLTIFGLRAPDTVALTAMQMAQADNGGLLFETWHVRRDGSRFPVEVSTRGATLGGVRTLLSVVRDVTERRAAEETARQWQRAFEQAELGIALCNSQGQTIRAANQAYARQHGYTPAELAGFPIERVYPPEEWPRIDALLRDADSRGGHCVYEAVQQRKDGSRFPVLVDVTAVRDASGRVTSRVAYVLDMTARQQAEERLRQTQKLESIGLLAGGIAHDFNNLLTGVVGNASMLLDDVPPRSAEMVKSILASAEQAAHLTRQLLAYSGKGQFYIENLDLSEAVREIMALIRLSVPRNVDVRMDLGSPLPPVAADPGQLQQVVMNLAINAGEAVGEGRSGTVTIATKVRGLERAVVGADGRELPAGCYVCLEVADTGCGMDEATRARIFDPFFSTRFTGRGLGLPAVAGIMRSQKGAITVESAPGQGSTFRVYFPAAGMAPDRAAVEASGSAAKTVLVVDDEEPVREFLKAALARRGYEVMTACNGEEALAICDTALARIGLIVLDIVMPAMGGHTFLGIVKARRPELKFLLTSGYSEAEARRLCASYGDTAFIQKPFTFQQLAAKLEQLSSASGPQNAH